MCMDLIMIYFTAGNHFCHGNIIGSCYRQFMDVLKRENKGV